MLSDCYQVGARRSGVRIDVSLRDAADELLSLDLFGASWSPGVDLWAMRLHQGIDCHQKLLCEAVFVEQVTKANNRGLVRGSVWPLIDDRECVKGRGRVCLSYTSG